MAIYPNGMSYVFLCNKILTPSISEPKHTAAIFRTRAHCVNCGNKKNLLACAAILLLPRF